MEDLFLSIVQTRETCGASRFTLLTGKYGPSHNGALSFAPKHSAPVFVDFRQNGYTSVSVGEVSHHRKRKTGMRMGISRYLNHGADTLLLRVHGNIHEGLCTAWQMVKFGRMQRTWTSTSPSMGRTPLPRWPDHRRSHPPTGRTQQTRSGKPSFWPWASSGLTFLSVPSSLCETISKSRTSVIPHPLKPSGE